MPGAMVAAAWLMTWIISRRSISGPGAPAGTVVCGGDNFMATTKFDVQFSGAAAHAGGKPEDGRNALRPPPRPALGCTPSRRTAPAPRGSTSGDAGRYRRNAVPSSALLKWKPAAKAKPLISTCSSGAARRRGAAATVRAATNCA